MIDAFNLDILFEDQNILEGEEISSWLCGVLEGKVSEVFYHSYAVDSTISGKIIKGYFEVRYNGEFTDRDIEDCIYNASKNFTIEKLECILL